MKISVDAKVLADAIATVMPSVGTGKVKPILACVLIESADGGCSVFGTNLEHSLSTKFPCDVRRAGACIVNPQRLATILRECSGPVTIDATEKGVAIKTDSGKFNLPYMDPSEFPRREAKLGVKFTVPGLGELIRKVSWAAGDADTKWTLSGVCIEVKGGLLSVAATNNLVAAVVDASDAMSVDDCKAMIPSAAAEYVQKMPGDVVVELTPNEATFLCGETECCTRLLEGKFPPVKDFLPKHRPTKVKMAVEPLMSAIRQVGTLTDGITRRIDCDILGGRMVLKVDDEHGEGEVELRGVDVKGDELETAFDKSNWLEFLKRAAGDVSIEFAGAKKSIILLSNGITGMASPLAR